MWTRRFAVTVVTPRDAERIARSACELARNRKARGKPGKVTCMITSNVLPRADLVEDPAPRPRTWQALGAQTQQHDHHHGAKPSPLTTKAGVTP